MDGLVTNVIRYLRNASLVTMDVVAETFASKIVLGLCTILHLVKDSTNAHLENSERVATLNVVTMRIVYAEIDAPIIALTDFAIHLTVHV
ncbi:hypothetical protein ScPMuIL_001931 [Solemya velum]